MWSRQPRSFQGVNPHGRPDGWTEGGQGRMTGRAGSGAASFVRLHGRLHRSFTISNNHHIESILSISPCSIGKKRERVRSEIRDEGVPIPRPSSTKLKLVSQFQWVATLSLRDNGCFWCMILENRGPIYTNCSSFPPLCHGVCGSIKKKDFTSVLKNWF